MLKFKPYWIGQTLDALWTAIPTSDIIGFSIDTRTIKPGDMFVALKGTTGKHGHEFLSIAAAKGASAALVEARQEVDIPQIVVPDTLVALQKLATSYRRSLCGPVIGLTGSSGKTSTKELLAHLLGRDTHKTEGNLNNHIGVPLTILAADPLAPFNVVETGISGAGEMEPLAQITQPDAALITLIGSAHLQNFKTREAIANEKGKLLQAVPPSGLCILHACELQYPIFQTLTAPTLILGQPTVDFKAPSHYTALKFEMVEKEDGWEITVGQHTYALPLWTPGMVRNAALCVVIAQHCGITVEQIALRLKSWPGAGLRGSWQQFEGCLPQSRIYLDAYNSNPEALADSLWRFNKMADPKAAHLYIIGTMAELGTESEALHIQAASEIILRLSDKAWLIGPQAPALAEGLRRSGAFAEQIVLSDDLEFLKRELTTFQGDAFVKGSHSTNLHTLSKLCSAI